ncbi:PilC/PilY family type IV pilus protein [Rhodoferax sediminis]|uniref:PilY1 beta-propeller domain-containing protein n=1 Tax=Rhodoferax sediminis TaxID=2509614 RepID=A0A515DET0_9BURK|nr:PilC/PilY family type IV pilus protein [Rhodoferax sediminis]QDL38918.1 hypothetical protein EUB48_17685 [Rhodoferax sediminis]
MKATHFLKWAALAALALACLGARADDIDIYSGAAANGPNPNVIIILDTDASNDASYNNTCSYGVIGATTQGFDATRCALYTALDTISKTPSLVGKLNIGLMGFGSGNNKIGLWLNPNPYPSSLPVMDGPGIAAAENTIATNTLATLKSGGAFAASAFQESWAFYTGNTGLSTHTYSDHINQVCQKSFIIYIGSVSTNSSTPSSGTDSGVTELNSAITTTNTATGGTIPLVTSSINSNGNPNFGPNTKYDSSSWMDEWSRFLSRNDLSGSSSGSQNIVTYTIAANFGGKQFNADYDQTLTSTAFYGGGKKFVVTDAQSMVNALLQIFNEVQAVNSVFASASLPVSASAQGTYLNQVFMGSFRPDPTGAPRWRGNLKQYQFGVDATNPASPQIFLADATGKAALSAAGTGFISSTAVSFWTGKDTSKSPDAAPPTGTNGFWVNNPESTGGAFDSPDGEVVEKGGVGQQIRLANLKDNYTTNPTGPRNVYTCLGSSCASGADLSTTPAGYPFSFSTSNSSITAAILGTNGPAMGITSITRSSSTATVTLSQAPSPALAAGQSVTIAGSKYPEFNGTFSITPLTTTTFTYPITIDPPSPSSGVYSASVPSHPIAISLTRSGTTVTATSSAAHGYVTGQTVTIAGATGSRYNGSYVVTTTGTNTFTYTITDGPATPDGGGTAKVGSTSYTIPAGSIARSPSNASNVSNVTVTLGSTITFSAGNTVTISGAGTGGVSAYNGSWTITNTGTSCPGGTKSGNQPTSFCFNINSTPASPDSSSTITADGGTSPLAITGLSYTAGTCSANSTALVTATTSLAPNFSAGSVVSIGGTVAASESAYVGSFNVVSVKTSAPYNFTYNIQTSPGNATNCTDSSSGMTASAQGVAKDALINWVRGSDNVGDEPSPGGGITIRPSVHGDVLHSRPAVINYGGSTGVVVFYGANDGMFRAINGNQPPATNTSPAPMGSCVLPGNSTCAIGGTPPGGELWSFVPSEFYPKLQRLYNNSPVVKLATTPAGLVPTPQPKDYFFDGTPGVYQNQATGKAYIFLSARRGGQLLYALDVSDPTKPKFMWKHTNADPGFSELGQTWSQPKVALIKGNANPVLIFGAGYDPNEDAESPNTDTMGRGIFILDAVTGQLLWRAGPGGSSNTCNVNPCQLQSMTYAMPADITLVDRNFDGYIDRLYAADVGGNIWRVDLEPVSGSTDLGDARVTLLAALGGTGTTKRKMFFPPDVVLTKNYDAVVASTGDREHPLYIQQAQSIVNRFYMIKDTNVGMSAAGWTTVHDDTSSTANAQPPMLFNATSTPYNQTLSGFYITLLGAGEKGVNAPQAFAGTVYFGTNTPTAPSTTSCQGNLGTALAYAVNLFSGQSSSVKFAGGGLAPSPVFGVVTVNVDGKPRQLPFMIGSGAGSNAADQQSSLGATKPVIPVNVKKKRTYWYRDIDR